MVHRTGQIAAAADIGTARQRNAVNTDKSLRRMDLAQHIHRKLTG